MLTCTRAGGVGSRAAGDDASADDVDEGSGAEGAFAGHVVFGEAARLCGRVSTDSVGMETNGQTHPARGHGEGSSLAGEGDSGDDEALGVHFGRLGVVFVKKGLNAIRKNVGLLLEKSDCW